jgi:hypothetical protein
MSYEYLTPAEAEKIIAARKAFYASEETARSYARKVDSQVRCFAEQGTYSTSSLVWWSAQVASSLIEDCFTIPNLNGKPVSIEALREEFERQVQQAEDGWDDPDDPWRPWEGLEAARAFLAATPYRVWKFVDTVEQRGRDLFSDSILEMIAGDSVDIQREVQKTYNKELDKLLKASEKDA